jgi:hypothetical protein
MPNLTPEGLSAVSDIAARQGFSVEAASSLLDALIYGGGTQAQFNHYEFGGMGQWSRGGMIMIGDMFNQGLKFRVDTLCNDLSNLLAWQPIVQAPAQATQPQVGETGIIAGQGSTWWPAGLGRPSSSGAQNEMRYAFFPDSRRLAILQGGRVQVYDSGDHLFQGVSQQQGGGQSLTFTSQYGTVQASDLPRVPDAPIEAAPSTPTYSPPPRDAPLPAQTWAAEPPAPARGAGIGAEEILKTIKSLAALRQEGILTDEEFAAKKAELLGRI